MGYWHLEAASQTEDGEGATEHHGRQVREKESSTVQWTWYHWRIGGGERERRVREGECLLVFPQLTIVEPVCIHTYVATLFLVLAIASCVITLYLA